MFLCVRFLPVTNEVKTTFVDRATALSVSAGWKPAEPAKSAWSHNYFHSWSDREIEAEAEAEEQKQANTQPAWINFVRPRPSSSDTK